MVGAGGISDILVDNLYAIVIKRIFYGYLGHFGGHSPGTRTFWWGRSRIKRIGGEERREDGSRTLWWSSRTGIAGLSEL